MSNDYGFDDDGEMAIPTMRGNANLDVQDYARGPNGQGSSFLDDDLQEDTLSTPGRNPGAAPAPDVEGMSRFKIAEDVDSPDATATTYGSYPWGPGSAVGYRPHSMQRTDMALRDSNLGDVDMNPPRKFARDDMHNEPEVLEVHDDVQVPPASWHGNRNQQPSNEGIPEDMLYDRTSYEFNDSTQSTIGSGVFDMEEGVTWRPRDGSFANQYALPAYLADEDDLGVQQSEMWDTTANEWRVVQPSAGGVTLATNVNSYKPGYSPFVSKPVPEMRQSESGPRSHVEAFGRKAARLIMTEAKSLAPKDRSRFVAQAADSLGAGTAVRTGSTAKRLVDLGQQPESALEDTLAHAIMHATVKDLQGVARSKGSLPNLDRLSTCVKHTRAPMQAAAAAHLGPLVRDQNAMKGDLGALFSSAAVAGMGQVTAEPVASTSPSFITPTRLLIGAAIGIGGYFAWSNRKSITRNAKKLARKAGLR